MSHYTFRVSKEAPKPRQKHQQGACSGCKQRKKKCDGRYPVCSTCEMLGQECTSVDLATGRTLRRDYVEQLEKEVADLKEQLGRKEQKPKELEMEVGYITLGTGGESGGYIGDSSAYSLACAITSTINFYAKKESTFTTPPDLQRELDQIPFTKPSMGMANNYLSSYYDNVQTQYPFLDWSCVSAWFYRVVHKGSMDNKDMFFIYMIFAIGSQVYNSHSTTASIYTKMYYSKALEHIAPLVEVTSLETVQAYLILSVFSQKMPDASSIWQTTGLAIRSAVILGLHREPYRKNDQDQDILAERVRQLKYRIFWCAYGLERINGIVLGRPFGIADIDIDTPLPKDGDTELSVALHVIKLRRIQSNICTFVYKPVQFMDQPEDIDATRVEIVLELNNWMSTFPSKDQSSSVFETENWCNISYHNSMLLLLRPVVLEVAQLKSQSNERALEWFKAFTQSASVICMNYKDLHSKGKLQYSWLTLHCAFVSGLSFLYCLWIDSNHLKVLALKRKAMVYDTISACSSILCVFAERFKTMTMFRDIYERVVRTVMAKLEQDSNCKMETTGALTEDSIAIDQYLSFELMQNKTHISSLITPMDENDDNRELWEFLDSTGDKFLRDIFYDMENSLKDL